MKVAVYFALLIVLCAIFSVDNADARRFKFKFPTKVKSAVSDAVKSAAQKLPSKFMTRVKNAGNRAKKVFSGTQALLKEIRPVSVQGMDRLSVNVTVTWSRWNQSVDSVLLPQMAFTFEDAGQSADHRAVVVGTRPSKLMNGTGLRPAHVVYDFSLDPTSAVTVVRAGRQCYQIPASAGLTFTSASAQLASSNGTNVTSALTEVKLNATGNKLDATATEALVNGNPEVEAFCAFLPIYEATTADPATFPALGGEGQDEMVISVLTLNSKVTILANKEAQLKRKINQMKKKVKTHMKNKMNQMKKRMQSTFG